MVASDIDGKEPGWRGIHGVVPVDEALAEYERAKVKLPPGTVPTVEQLQKPWLQHVTETGPPRPGPKPQALPRSSRKDLEIIRDSLAAEGKYHGYKSIAKVAGIHPSTVRRRFGKL